MSTGYMVELFVFTADRLVENLIYKFPSIDVHSKSHSKLSDA